MENEGNPSDEIAIIRESIAKLDPEQQRQLVKELFISQFQSQLGSALTEDITRVVNTPQTSNPIVESSAPTQERESAGKKWADIINERGGKVLMAKMMKDWTDYSVPPTPSSHTANDFKEHGRSGNVSRLYSDQLTGLLYQRDYNGQNKDSNYLISSAAIDPLSDPGRRLSYDGSQTFRNLTYLGWQHMNFTPDSRGHHTPFSFTFTLPDEDALALLEEVKANPDLIEEVYQNSYPNLSERGVKRIKQDTLQMIELPDNERDTITRIARNPQNDMQTYKFSHSVGEVEK